MNPSSPASPGSNKLTTTSEAGLLAPTSRARAHAIVLGRMGKTVAWGATKVVLWPSPTVGVWYAIYKLTGKEGQAFVPTILVAVFNIIAFATRKFIARDLRRFYYAIKYDWEHAKRRYRLAVDEAQKKLEHK